MKKIILPLLVLVTVPAFADSKVCGKVSKISAHAMTSEIEIGIESDVGLFKKETTIAIQRDLRDAALALVSTSKLTDKAICISTAFDTNKGYEVARSIELNMSKQYTPTGNN